MSSLDAKSSTNGLIGGQFVKREGAIPGPDYHGCEATHVE